MTLTLFFPIFVLLVFFSARSFSRWAQATIFSSFFQAASPILLSMGGAQSGLQPAYALIPIGLLHAISGSLLRRPINRTSPSHHTRILMLVFTLVVALGGFFLPFLFDNVAHVISPRLHNTVALLHFQSANIVQVSYVVFNFLLFTLVSVGIESQQIEVPQCTVAIAAGTLMSCALGIYQIVSGPLHLPWPDSVLNSNLGAAQLFNEQTSGFIRSTGITTRMSSTFVEPSLMAVYYLGGFSFFAFGLKNRGLSGLLLLCLLISTSATALIGLAGIIACFVIAKAFKSGVSVKSAAVALFALAFFVSLLMLYINDPQHFLESSFIAEKQSSESGRYRSTLDALVIPSLKETYGLGVGIGSTRLSSFVTTFAACSGIPGLICIVALFYTLLSHSLFSESTESRAYGMALAGILIGWSISVPDISIPIVWILSGLLCGISSRVRRVSELPKDFNSSTAFHESIA